jgi:glycosyltransferase involved in cell wall biosynthesis
LVYDAGSTDGSKEIYQRYPHLLVTTEPDKGMSEAINKGFRRARGEWVMWLNADDRLKPGALAEALAFVQRHPATDVAFGAFDFIHADGSLQRRVKLLPFVRLISVHHGCYVASTAAFYNRQRVIGEGFLLDERFKAVMDGEFYARLGRAGKKFRYFPVVLADFRVHGGNLSLPNLGERRTIAGEMLRAELAIETVAIRRTYGFTPFDRYELNHATDFALFLAAWGLKGLLKLPYWFCLREPSPASASTQSTRS